MSFTKFTLAAALLLSLTACSSGSSNGSGSAELQTQLELAKQNLEKAKTELEKLKSDVSVGSELLVTAQTELNNAESALAKVSAELAESNSQLTIAKADLEKAEKAVVEATEANVAAQTRLDNVQAQLVESQNRVKQLESDQNSTAEQLAAARSMLINVQQEVQQAAALKRAAEGQLNTVQSSSTAFRSAVSRIQEQQSRQATDVERAKERYYAAQTLFIQTLQRDRNRLSQELNAIKQQLTQAEQGVNQAAAEKQAVENQLNSAKADLSAAQQQLQKLQADQQTSQAKLTDAKQNLVKAEQAVSEATVAKQAVESQLNTAQTTLANTQKALDSRNAVVNEMMEKGRAVMQSLSKEGQMLTKPIESLPTGLSKNPFITISDEEENGKPSGIMVGNRYVYISPNTDLKMWGRAMTAFWNSEALSGEFSFRIDNYTGTKTADLPSGSATYHGIAFAADTKGKLNYQVDFAAKTGVGSISEFSHNLPDIQLAQGNITNRGVEPYHRIRAEASTQTGDKGSYYLDFFGQNAETVAGKLYMFKSYDGVVKSNGGEMENFNAQERGTVFGLVGERQP